MVRDTGFEPACKCCVYQGSGATDSQIHSQSFRDHPEMTEIAAAWADLPDALKAAVLGIVRVAGKRALGRMASHTGCTARRSCASQRSRLDQRCAPHFDLRHVARFWTNDTFAKRWRVGHEL